MVVDGYTSYKSCVFMQERSNDIFFIHVMFFCDHGVEAVLLDGFNSVNYANEIVIFD